MKKFFGPHARNVFKLFLTIFVCEIIFRMIFVLYFKSSSERFLLSELAKALYLGFKFDIRVALILTLPFALFGNLFRQSHYWRSLWSGFYGFVTFIFLMGYFLDFGYFSYLESRVNGTALKFLQNPIISFNMMRESYPLGWITLSLLFLTTGLIYFFKKKIFSLKSQRQEAQFSTKWGVTVSALIVSLIFIGGLYGKLSFYPLRWSEAFFSNNNFISAVALNPWHYFADTIKASKKTYDRSEVEKYYPTIATYLGVKNMDLSQLNFLRTVPAQPLFKKKLNIVVIVMESFASFKLNSQGMPAEVETSPYFDSLANKGVLFENFFVPSEGTARSVFGLISGVPDVTQYRTSSRNPLIAKQNSAANSLDNYDKYYFIGGSANWGEIRGLVSSSITGVKIIEEGMFQKPRSDVWGISDLHLFEEADRIFNEKESKNPFFALIQTAGFHRPYTIPEDHRNFELKSITPEQVAKYGFHSVEELNSIRFSDFALGQFIETAKKSPYYKDTLFVIIGDHGLPHRQASHISKGERKYGFSRFRVPLLFYSPNHLQPKRIKTLATEPDVLVTAAAITGHSVQVKGMGRNLFALDPTNDNLAFIYTYHQTPKPYGIVTDKYYVGGNTASGVTGIYNYKTESFEKNLKNEDPGLFDKYHGLAEGYYQTSRYMLFHNQLIEHSPMAVKEE